MTPTPHFFDVLSELGLVWTEVTLAIGLATVAVFLVANHFIEDEKRRANDRDA